MQFITSGDRIATENFTLGRIYTVTFSNGNYFINTCIGIGPDYVMFQQTAPKMLFRLDMETAANVDTIDESGGGSGTTNYNELDNKPQINGVTLQGNKTLGDLSIYPVPIVTSEDNNKILTASYVGGSGSYSWQPAPSSGTTNYNELNNKPQINSIELSGNKSLADFGIASAEALAGKQDVISDLSTIRSGAAAGATAVQPGTLSGYQTLIDSSHKLSSDLVDDEGNTNKFATAAQLAQIETNKNNISTICDYGGKNIFEPTITSGEYYGLTITVNADNSISISNSTPLSESKYIILGTSTPKTVATYTFDGTPSGVTVDTGGYMRIEQGSTGISQVLTPVDIDLNNTQAYTVFLRVLAGKTYNITLRPMLCFKSLYQASSTYEPYAPSNRELYEMIKALQ